MATRKQRVHALRENRRHLLELSLGEFRADLEHLWSRYRMRMMPEVTKALAHLARVSGELPADQVDPVVAQALSESQRHADALKADMLKLQKCIRTAAHAARVKT